jgi:hypothetical protein
MSRHNTNKNYNNDIPRKLINTFHPLTNGNQLNKEFELAMAQENSINLTSIKVQCGMEEMELDGSC